MDRPLVTLNITILTRQIIYQSADYALFDPQIKKPLQLPSTKAVVLNTFDWTGFITYTGIGRVGTKHTSEYIREWIRDLNRPSFEDVVERIRDRASAWVQAVSPGQIHTFVVAGFVDGFPKASVVSNFEKWHGYNLHKIAEHFVVSTVNSKQRPTIIVTGIRKAIPRQRRRALIRLATDYPHDGSRVRRTMAEATRNGARLYPGKISEDCFVYSQDMSGQGHYEPIGTTRTENPISIGDADADRLMRNSINKMLGMGGDIECMKTFRSRHQSSPPALCAPELSAVPTSARYRVEELATSAGRRARPRSINASGIIVGEASERWEGPSYPCVWRKPSQLEFLTHGGGFGGAVYDINDSEVMVGYSEWPDRATHACIWKLDEDVMDIGGVVARNSQATALNADGSIVGWASIHPTESGQAHYRPVHWPKYGSAVILKNIDEGWGEAVDITSKGVVLIRAHKGGNVALSQETGAWIWDGAQAQKIDMPSGDLACFYPHRLTDEGRIAGLTINKNGERGGAVRGINGMWSPLFTPAPGREFTAVNRQLLIAGYDSVNGYDVPWIKREGGEVMYLPHYKYHHHVITKVSEQGWAVGTASSDNCRHPMLWTPIRAELF